jgi:hypothetical protein
MIPIGPARISTSLPNRREKAVWNWVSAGIEIAATSRHGRRMSPDIRHGSVMLSANAPGLFTPHTLSMRARVLVPQIRHFAANDVAFAAYDFSWRNPLTFDPTSTISPTNSCPMINPTVSSSAPTVPLVDVEVGAADAGVWTRMRTSLMPIVGRGASSRRRPVRLQTLLMLS